MGLLDLFARKKNSAQAARERLQIIIQHQRANENQPEYIPLLRKEIVAVITKYIDLDKKQVEDVVQVALSKDGNLSKLELNIMLPEKVAQRSSEAEAA